MGDFRLSLVLFVTVVGALFASGVANAAVFNVNSTDQLADVTPGNGTCATAQGTCTLRAALEESNALLGADEVRVPAGDYPITTFAPTISQSLTLRGPDGAAATRFDSGGTGNRWSISGGGNVQVEGVTITGVNGPGSAMSINGPDTTFRGVSIDGNRATSTHGAGMRIQTAQVTMVRSSVTNNLAETSSTETQGGGISVMFGSSLTAIASTIADNSIKSSGSTGWGGGIYAGGQLVLRHVTLSGNSVHTASFASYAGNLFINKDVQATVEDSIVIGGSTGSGQARNCGMSSNNATLTTTGKNIYESVGNYSCDFSPGTVAATSTAMTDLGDHGGTGLTYVPLANSAAVDGASTCPEGGLDQRGAKAPAGAACDIGAAELNADLRVTLNSAPGPVAPGAAVFHTAILANTGMDTATATTLQITPASGLSVLSVSEGSCSAAGQCSLGTMAPGAIRAITFTTRAPANGPLITKVSGAADTPDPTPGDATASATTEVIGAPVITKLRAVGKLRSGKRGKLRMDLSRDATVRIVVTRKVKGKRAAGRCRAGAKKGKRCQTFKKIGVLTAKRKAGKVTVPLPRRLGGRKLAPGRYRLSATATAPGGLRSKAVKATVKVGKKPARKG